VIRRSTKNLNRVSTVEQREWILNWLTVVSPDEPDGTQLVLEPNAHPAAAPYQKGLYESGVPLTSLSVDDIQGEFERLKEVGVTFTMEPTDVGTAILAVFDDTCGNLIQIYQEK